MPTHDPAQSRRPVNVCDSADLAPSAHPERGPQPPSPSSPLGRRRKPGGVERKGYAQGRTRSPLLGSLGNFQGFRRATQRIKKALPRGRGPWGEARGQTPLLRLALGAPHRLGTEGNCLPGGHGGLLRGVAGERNPTVSEHGAKKKGERGALGKEAARLPCLR